MHFEYTKKIWTSVLNFNAEHRKSLCNILYNADQFCKDKILRVLSESDPGAPCMRLWQIHETNTL